MQTRLYKGRDGWKAETTIDLEAPYTLKIGTSKRSGGGISTIATRVKIERDESTGYTGYSFVVYQDFSKTVQADRAARCTEKTVTTMHAAALAQLDQIKADCAAHYAKGA